MPGSVRLGPFSVGDTIGEGGMGTVYRATHRTTGVPVALKVIRRRANQRSPEKFHDEVQAHAGLIHPGIVYLFEYGNIDEEAAEETDGELREGSPYVAMELADRGTVREAMPFSDWTAVRRLLVQTLDALAHAHARDVVHRDLKPENLLVFDADEAGRAGRRVKLADFGIAHATDRARSTDPEDLSSPAGTPRYMAPEQLRGEWREYGPWTDLYAVGCITWELICGAPPFDGDHFLDFALKHEEEERPPLDPQFPVPDDLEKWVHRAMAIDHGSRFRHTADALRTLPEADRGSRQSEAQGEPGSDAAVDGATQTGSDTERAWSTQIPTLAPTETLDRERLPDSEPKRDDTAGSNERIRMSEPPVPESWRRDRTDPPPAPLVGTGLGLFDLREPPFVDRERECDEIWAALQRVADRNRLELVFVRGDAGTGKSRLAEWMSTRARELGAARVLRAVHTPGGGSNEGLTGAFERAFRTVQLDRGDVYERLLDNLPALEVETDEQRVRDACALTEFLLPTDSDSGDFDGPAYRFSSARQRRALVVRTLERLAGPRPVVLWIDDLQWASRSLGVLEYLHETRDAPSQLMVLATVRSDVVTDSPNLEKRLDQLQSADYSSVLSISPLARNHQRELLDGLVPLESELADRLAERTEGHPLFAMQLLGHWIDRGDIRVGSGGFFRLADDRKLELPTDIHELWMERLERLLELYPESRRTDGWCAVELAAALGREVDGPRWKAVLADAGIAPLEEMVNGLVERGLAERTNQGWAFAHGLLVDALEERARRAGRWRGHHRLCARVLESILPGDELGYRERLANHWIQGGELERALEPLLDEIQLYTQREADEEVRRLLERREAVLDEFDAREAHPGRLAQEIERGRLEMYRGNLDAAESMFREVRQTAPSSEPRLLARAFYRLSEVALSRGNHERSRRLGRKALELAREAGDAHLVGRCHARIAWLHFYENDYEDAERQTERMADVADRTDDAFLKLMALRTRATIFKEKGVERAGELYERVRSDAAEAGYVEIEVQALNGLGHQARFDGRIEEARKHYAEYGEKARELGRPLSEAVANYNLAVVEVQARNLEAANEHLETFEEILDAVGASERWAELRQLIRLALAAGRGNGAKFRRVWDEIEPAHSESRTLRKEHPWLLEHAAELALEAGWQERANDVLRLARDLWRECGDDDAAEKLASRLDD